MADTISLLKLKSMMESRLKGGGEDFDEVFYLSVNDVIRDLMNTTLLEVTEIDEDTPPETLDVDSKYFGVFRDGIQFWMQQNATWARVGEQQSNAQYLRSLALARAEAMEDADPDMGLDYEDDD
jgi:hypothetical protein